MYLLLKGVILTLVMLVYWGVPAIFWDFVVGKIDTDAK